MKRILAMGLLGVMGLMIAGCEGPIAARQDPYSPLQVSMTDTWVRDRVLVNKVVPERIGAGQLKVTVELYNKTNGDLLIDYRRTFTDARGVAVDNPVGWQLVRLPPRGYNSFSFTSMSAMAEDFRVQLRRSEAR